MTLTKKFEENRLTIIGTADSPPASGCRTSKRDLLFPGSHGAVSPSDRSPGPAVFSPAADYTGGDPGSSRRRQLYHRRSDVRTPVRLLSELCRNGHRICDQFSPGKTLWTDLSFKVCIRRNFSEIHFLDRKRKEIRYILSSGFDPSRYA